MYINLSAINCQPVRPQLCATPCSAQQYGTAQHVHALLHWLMDVVVLDASGGGGCEPSAAPAVLPKVQMLSNH
jgi:hypothetical protein